MIINNQIGFSFYNFQTKPGSLVFFFLRYPSTTSWFLRVRSTNMPMIKMINMIMISYTKLSLISVSLTHIRSHIIIHVYIHDYFHGYEWFWSMVMTNGYDQWLWYLCYFGSYHNVIRMYPRLFRNGYVTYHITYLWPMRQDFGLSLRRLGRLLPLESISRHRQAPGGDKKSMGMWWYGCYTLNIHPQKKHQTLHPLNFSTFSIFRLENWKNQDSPVDLGIECQPKPGGDTEGMDRDELTMMRYSGIWLTMGQWSFFLFFFFFLWDVGALSDNIVATGT